MEVTLSKQHIAKIDAIGLGIHLASASNAIESLTRFFGEGDSNLDMAVEQFCKNQTNSYNRWVYQLMQYAEFHGISLKSALSVFNDAGEGKLKDLYWPSGFQNDASAKLGNDFKSGNPLESIAGFYGREIEILEHAKREADQNESDADGNPTYNDDWSEADQEKLNTYRNELKQLEQFNSGFGG